ncbi:MAG: prepilin-type N-terminal cleavage/methylation domain-containing protein [Candidatus Hydrogenedentes bacterium]|nr:prepilin-type N-terminal cleavage/methylation domain-containing protein [Candidatus Hydrogenedentota bacterium]
MKRSRRQGLTLIELTISIAVLSLIAAAAAALLSVCLQAQAHGMARSSLQREGALAMERMVSQIRKTSRIAIPNGQQPLRDQLALAEGLNNDGDFYFDDPLFPRIDEDGDDDNNGDGASGIKGYDDDGDGVIDEDAAEDNDEDGTSGEDKADGLDDDGDGMVDEDTPGDANADGASGLAGADDDGDGEIDEGDAEDDDEDGVSGEDPPEFLVYAFDAKAKTLTEYSAAAGQSTVLSAQVTAFEVNYEPVDTTRDARLTLTLSLTGPDGETVTFRERVYPRNLVSKWGRRVL